MDQNIFATHPIYVDYEASTDGIVRHKQLQNNIGIVDKFGYMIVTV